jgi:hypothetical protein
MIIPDLSLEFARAHIEAFYDSDFFPKPDEYKAIWARWDEVKTFLSATNVGKLEFDQPRTMPARKTSRGYRIVHQLDPFAAIVYTALAHHVAAQVEAARAPQDVAFAYRIALSSSGFFGPAAGYGAFIQRCKALAEEHTSVLSTDVSDFYNRLYIHRVQNAIAAADPMLEAAGKDIESFLMKLNGGASQGIPVGPAASIVMAEAVMTDIDDFIKTAGFKHARYVDDIRVFGPKAELERLLEQLVQHLYDEHRLQLAAQKTALSTSDAFVSRLKIPEQYEGARVTELIHAVSHYGEASESELADWIEKYAQGAPKPAQPATPPEPNDWFGKMLHELEEHEHRTVEDIRARVLTQLLQSGLDESPMDLGLVRHALRQAKRWGNPVIAELVLSNIEILEPALPEAMMYLNSLPDDAIGERMPQVRDLLMSPPFNRSAFFRHWVYWLVTSKADLVNDSVIGPYVWRAPLVWHMRAARTARNLTAVRAQRSAMSSIGPWDRRAVILAAQILPKGERDGWLGTLSKTVRLDECLIDFVTEKKPKPPSPKGSVGDSTPA